MFNNILELMVWGRKSRTYKSWLIRRNNNMDRCAICESVFGPKAVGHGVNQLQTFKGYTVDFPLREFRSLSRDAGPEFIDFDSPQGLQLCAMMHDAAINQLHKQFVNFAM
jgi:hypothetical protein